MAKLVDAKEVEQIVRRHLEGKGCTLSRPKKHGQTGSDITARTGKSTWFVEVIGFQAHPPTRSREFYEAFFRVVSRDSDNPDDVLVLALPKRFKDGMRQRKQQYPLAWEKPSPTLRYGMLIPRKVQSKNILGLILLIDTILPDGQSLGLCIRRK